MKDPKKVAMGKKSKAQGQQFELRVRKVGCPKGTVPWNKGKHHSPETCDKIRIKLIGNKNFLNKQHTEETKEKIRNSNYHKNIKGRKGSENYYWKGDDAKYGSIHGWVNKNFNLPKKCELCGCTDKKLEWSNKDHKYKREISDWQAVCRSCHRRYDNGDN